RLIGVEAPELNHPTEPTQCFSKESRLHLEKLILGKQIILESEPLDNDKDVYGRLLRYAFTEDGVNITEQMILDGYALEYTYTSGYKYQSLYKEAQSNAQKNNNGLWSESTCNGDLNTGTY